MPLPAAQRESYWEAMRLLNELLLQAIELSKVNNGNPLQTGDEPVFNQPSDVHQQAEDETLLMT